MNVGILRITSRAKCGLFSCIWFTVSNIARGSAMPLQRLSFDKTCTGVTYVRTGSGQTCYAQFLHVWLCHLATGARQREYVAGFEAFLPVLSSSYLLRSNYWCLHAWSRHLWELHLMIFYGLGELCGEFELMDHDRMIITGYYAY